MKQKVHGGWVQPGRGRKKIGKRGDYGPKGNWAYRNEGLGDQWGHELRERTGRLDNRKLGKVPPQVVGEGGLSRGCLDGGDRGCVG